MDQTTKILADGCLVVERDGPLARITFNNPKRRNAMTFAMWRDLAACFEDLAKDRGLRVAVLTGAGDRAFVSGADISEFGEKRGSADAISVYNAGVARAGAALEAFPVPIIAAICGACIGGGMGIALRCDLRLCSTDARFGIPAARLGLGYDFKDLAIVEAAIGAQCAADMLYSARYYDAEEAKACGLVARVLEPDALIPAVEDLAQTIAANAPLTIRAAKAGLRSLRTSPTAEAETKVDALVASCFASTDYVEGRAAFAGRRTPAFKGH